MPQLTRILLTIGMLLILAGLAWWLAGDRLNWIGRLPGDIRIEKENMRFYFPVTTMIIASVILSVIVWLIRKFFG